MIQSHYHKQLLKFCFVLVAILKDITDSSIASSCKHLQFFKNGLEWRGEKCELDIGENY